MTDWLLYMSVYLQSEGERSGAVTVGYMPSLNQVSGLTQTGELHSQTAIQVNNLIPSDFYGPGNV